MNLVPMPPLTFPITQRQANALMENVVKLNVLDAGLSERTQKALDLVFESYEVLAKGGPDYTGEAGHRELAQSAMNFAGDGSPIITRHGDLRAAHLAISFNNTQAALKAAGMPLLTTDVNVLLTLCKDFATFPPRTEDRIDLFLGYLRKK